MSTKQRPTRRWAATAVATSVSAALAAPMSVGTASASTAVERPMLTITDVRSGVIALHAVTNPALKGATVYFYKVAHGEKKIIGYAVTGRAGHAKRRIHLPAGTVHKFVAKAVGLNNRHRFQGDTSTATHYRSKFSNRVTYRIPS